MQGRTLGSTSIHLGVKECIVGADGCSSSVGADGYSSSAFHTIVSALVERCQALEEEVKNVTQERAAILEEALHNLNLEDD
ncbi:uncharacterized protein G2W53_017986 [Senna tora]|uniref:Uncharacterized protein n=1 Tax=Senna tora TaxID=362788 RepID=A0A834WKZ0_9FABA|nr:uncharacterized protein G2W53_017986 [Senna tora]